MPNAKDKSRTASRGASRGAESTSAADSAAKQRSRKTAARNGKHTNIADNGPPTASTDPNSYTITTPSSRTKCFRISGIPHDWEKDDLLGALQAIDPDLRNQKPQLSLYPACRGPRQTALFELDTTKYFQSLSPNEPNYARVSPPNKNEVVLTIDSHFYDLTPLNAPDKQIIAELVAFCLPNPNSDANTGLIEV